MREEDEAQVVESSPNPRGRPKKHTIVEIKPKAGQQEIPRKKVSRIVELHLKNVSRRDIAVTEQLSPTTVQKVLNDFKPFFKEIPNLDKFKACKADILDAALLMLLKTMMSQDRLDKASVNNLAYAAQQMFTMSRLERGQSTSNTQTVTVSFTGRSSFSDGT